jgi:hypothetical protein
MTLFIQATTLGIDAGPLFDIFTNSGFPVFTTAVATNVTNADLLTGITITVPDDTTVIKITSNGDICNNSVYETIGPANFTVYNDVFNPAQIVDIRPYFYTNLDATFPIFGDAITYTGYHADFSGDLLIDINNFGIEGFLSVLVDGVLQYCQLISTGAGIYTYTIPITVLSTQLVEIKYTISPC